MVSGASGAARLQKAQSWKGPNTIGTRERAWQKRQKTRRDIQRRTRRSASTIGGAATDTIIGRAAADRAGARPYRATRCENASPETPIRQYADPPTRFPFAEWSLYDPRSGSNPRLLSLANVSFWTAVFGCGSATGLGSLRSSSANLEQSNPEKRWCCGVLPSNCDLPTCLNENLVTPLTGSYSAA